MAFIDLIEPSVVQIPVRSKTKSEVLRELVDLLDKAGKLISADKALSALLDREAKGSTGLEEGIAVPHAKCDAVDQLTVAIGIAPDGIDFQAMDGKPSNLFFLLLAPPEQAGQHIEALSEIAKLTRSKSFCRLLLASQTPEEVVELFQEE
ncbi:PTS sugar transporter subunit IIA [Sediminispirochaeta smaragdinae]|jgi:fructose-specific phosphotransferase system IIA component|uniref:PTS IIA-like nitrogen-regulatory protein PtsN n=1 Tax=Sediminispirochaeta smaragdinae (strain DSM 11293 / JCM 15392 / SEBR 4228) TaxID=573413 RepID=E1R4W4_SEDSS|nr:PTS sugar transporter subunit IIA [Sediminispirochaeta smaragdinae]ADK82202.1 putative PTS IIA-like nitrogen-regulatory protein PtsN [Sediminispirochaeta smaragdinae DSM 11293]